MTAGIAAAPAVDGQQVSYRVFPADVITPALARSFARRVAEVWGLADRSDDITLCVSELATNAVVHGTGPVTVRLSREPGGVVLAEVADAASCTPRLAERDPAAERGRGLAIVAALATTWGVRSGGCHGECNGKTVWFCLGGDA